jgi:hypothetical protein
MVPCGRPPLRARGADWIEPPTAAGRPGVGNRKPGPKTGLARPAGLEPATPGLEGRCSIQLSYGRLCSTDYLKFAQPTLPVPSHVRHATLPVAPHFGHGVSMASTPMATPEYEPAPAQLLQVTFPDPLHVSHVGMAADYRENRRCVGSGLPKAVWAMEAEADSSGVEAGSCVSTARLDGVCKTAQRPVRHHD